LYTPEESVTGLGSVVTSSFALAAIRPNGGSDATQAAQEAFTVSVSPNPAHDMLTLSYSLAENATITIEIVDVLQRTIATPLLNHAQTLGSYALGIPTAHLPAGTYNIRVQTNTESGGIRRTIQPVLITH
jgi:hypothetical protein